VKIAIAFIRHTSPSILYHHHHHLLLSLLPPLFLSVLLPGMFLIGSNDVYLQSFLPISSIVFFRAKKFAATFRKSLMKERRVLGKKKRRGKKRSNQFRMWCLSARVERSFTWDRMGHQTPVTLPTTHLQQTLLPFPFSQTKSVLSPMPSLSLAQLTKTPLLTPAHI
jgi:hypothetical protein